ncbi:MAG: S-layer homology domain-containing protein, partial [Clostridia bacterium]|nr:S-layer homology domain-containing protein [Clostridia bacterium]
MKLKKIVSAALAFLMLSGCIMIGSASAADDEGLPFKDVGKKKWFYDAVKYVYDGGLMNGTTADKFEPNANLSRAMFITILGRLAGAET